ncbi:MAG: DUF1501 domain-containing protein [Thermoguttaceae bacterium]
MPLVVLGLLVADFAAADPQKRSKLIERLLGREEFADFWALKWSDLLEIKAEEPINLWPKAAETYHRWVRDSYNLVMSALVAGGGFQAGKVVGESDEEGRYVKSRPIYPWDLWESVYQLLGIDPNDKLPNPDGCVAYVSPATACSYARGGILKEIM